MVRRSLQRIGKIEEQLSAARTELNERRKLWAWQHAVDVAAIVLWGEPKINEPLFSAKIRALQHLGNYKSGPEDDRHFIARQLPFSNSRVEPCTRRMVSEEASEQFTAILKKAPVWLLQFTATALDTYFLKFDLPDLTKTLKWGSAGYEQARSWPYLPTGTMTAGEPIPARDDRWLWIIPACMITCHDFDVAEKILFREPEKNIHRKKDKFVDDLLLFLDLENKPEEEWSSYEKRRMRKLIERLNDMMVSRQA